MLALAFTLALALPPTQVRFVAGTATACLLLLECDDNTICIAVPSIMASCALLELWGVQPSRV